jgi:hypothetical protein
MKRKWYPILAACTVLSLSSSVLAAERCDYVFGTPNINENDLIDLTNGRVIGEGYQLPRATKSILLGYIVPQNTFQTGVFIVKSRHKIVTQQRSAPAGSGNTITVERGRYTSPCSKRDIVAYSHDADVQRYIDYHFYGLRDPEPNRTLNLEFAHADVGIRESPNSWPLPASRACLNTRYDTIRAQFLYGDDRRVASAYETLSRQYSLFSGAFGTPSAYAAPPAYREYDSLKTMVIPYVKRPPNAPACFAFNLPIPANTVITEVMIVDADKAFASSGFDPQRSWTISPAPSPVRSVSIRR